MRAGAHAILRRVSTPSTANHSAGAIIVAAGQSRRMAGVDKLLAPLAGVPVIARAVEAFESHRAISAIVVVASGRNIAAIEALRRERGWRKVAAVCLGGARRQDSVRNGLVALPPCGWVLVHDGARPLVSARLIAGGLAAVRARGTGAAIPVVPLKDTVKHLDAAGRVLDTPDRATLAAIQTPQVFPRTVLERAHREVTGDVTDDAAMVEALGLTVRTFPGDPANIKVTTPHDLAMAEAMLRQAASLDADAQPAGAGDRPAGTDVGPRPAFGIGYDAHPLVAGRPLVLAGVPVPYERGLDGHSDGDVATHAIIDALLGAAALGDIGTHFKETDPTVPRGVSSLALLTRTVAMVRQRGFEVGNVDATIVAQRPRLAGHVPAMRAALARAIGIGLDRVSIKATTEDGMGFTGTGQGISAMAVASLTGMSSTSGRLPAGQGPKART